MARDVNALINKCENAITQEEKTISDAKEKIRKLRKEIKKLKAEKDNQFANDLLVEQIINRAVSRKVHGNPCCLHCCVYFLSVHERHTENIQTTGYPIGLQLIRI